MKCTLWSRHKIIYSMPPVISLLSLFLEIDLRFGMPWRRGIDNNKESETAMTWNTLSVRHSFRRQVKVSFNTFDDHDSDYRSFRWVLFALYFHHYSCSCLFWLKGICLHEEKSPWIFDEFLGQVFPWQQQVVTNSARFFVAKTGRSSTLTHGESSSNRSDRYFILRFLTRFLFTLHFVTEATSVIQSNREIKLQSTFKRINRQKDIMSIFDIDSDCWLWSHTRAKESLTPRFSG